MLLNQIKFPFTAFLMAVLVVAPLPTNAGQRFDIPDPSQWRVQPPTKAMKKTLTKLTLGLEVLYNEYHDYQVSKAQAMRQGKAVAAFASKRTMAHLISENVVVDMTASAAPELLRQDLLGLGANSISVYGQLVSASVPMARLAELAQLATVKIARPALFMRFAGSVTSQGDVAMYADNARALYNVDGSGTTVGILSDSYDCLQGASAGIASGDLPATVTVLADDATTGCSNTDEGRAMLEIVHDVAPGASLAFNTANLGQAGFAQGILNLANMAGASVIADDVIYLTEPMFQDGSIAQAVDTVVSQGVAYFSSAGNNAKNSYEANFVSGGTLGASAFVPGTPFAPTFEGGVAHDFSGGGDYYQQITMQPNSSITLVLEWDNAFPSLGGTSPTAADVDVYLVDTPYNGVTPSLVLAGSTVSQSSGADPVEIFGISYNGTVAATANLLVVNRSGSAPGRVKYVAFTSGVSFDEYGTNSSTLYGHANAKGAVAVGAARYAYTPAFGVSPPLLESFSSRGGTPIYFDRLGSALSVPELRSKPEIVAPDGGNTTFFYPGSDYEGDGFPNFFGTSAAAPHAAGAAALLRSFSADLTPLDIAEAMQETAVDMNSTGFDVDTGFGLINVNDAIAFIYTQKGNDLLGFATLSNGDALVAGDTFDAAEFATRGVTIADNDTTPSSVTINTLAGNVAGFSGNFIQVDGASPQFTLTFSPPVQTVEFDFVSASGVVNTTAKDSLDHILASLTFSGSTEFIAAGISGQAGHATIIGVGPISTLTVDAAAIDNLLYGSDVPVVPVQQIPFIPQPLAWLLLMVIALTGVWVIRRDLNRNGGFELQ